MAVSLNISMLDANGETAKVGPTIGDAANAVTVAQHIENMSNAKTLKADISTPVDISGLTGNTATAANVESAKFKARLTYSGPIPAGGTRRVRTSILVPAPHGALVDGLSGDLTNADAVALAALLTDELGNPMDILESIEYV